MTSHELARQLLAGPDQPVALAIACANDTISTFDENGNPGPNEAEGGNIGEIQIEHAAKATRLSVYLSETSFGYMDD